MTLYFEIVSAYLLQQKLLLFLVIILYLISYNKDYYYLSLKIIIVRPRYRSLLQTKKGGFLSHFRHHFSFIQLGLYTKARMPNRMPFTACQNTKYFRFFRTLNFIRNEIKIFAFSYCFYIYEIETD